MKYIPLYLQKAIPAAFTVDDGLVVYMHIRKRLARVLVILKMQRHTAILIQRLL